MKPLISAFRCLSGASLGVALATSSAFAKAQKIPDPNYSTVGQVVVGNSSGKPVGGGFEVVVRSSSGVPVMGAQVTLQFQGTGMAPYGEQEAGTGVNCSTATLSKWTDAEGRAVFSPRVGGFENSQRIYVRANGVRLRIVAGRSTDLDADGATGLQDQLLFFQNRFTRPGAPETDYDDSGTTDIFDQLIFFQDRFSGMRGAPCP